MRKDVHAEEERKKCSLEKHKKLSFLALCAVQLVKKKSC